MLRDKYFGYKLNNIVWVNSLMEVIVAATGTGGIGASGGVVAGWSFWKSPEGIVVWAVLGSVAAATAWAKPFLKLDKRIELYSKLQQEYRSLYNALETLIASIRRAETVTNDHWDRYEKIRDRRQAAFQQEPPRINLKLERKCQVEVNQEKPPNTLWMPKVPGVHPRLAGGPP
jgi:hypothetical protein